ncbi:similar to Saccharomyces cerevisiae YNL139C THO2 Subunit of the THO complex [Maudiozyma saulgeensis]|uniref:THO complex subunit 2 n=1 Tax=Maudiozyma saulgeensis TaxID=1789683 RepID=A0A1X7QY78_9SACH|nr:similar to Saccharomyces cerevisiae YNL139C THO2 Subunit of the THO complex [Kazachstania saulgeensis]
MSLIDRLNKIAKQQQQILLPASKGTILTGEYITGDEKQWDNLIDDLKRIEDDSDREQWLRTFFIELFQILFAATSTLTLSIKTIALFINDLTKILPTRSHLSMSSMVGKSFIAAMSCVPEAATHEDMLIELVTKTTRIHSEVFKFSWLSSKLTNRAQTQLLRHLLKKSKYEITKFNLLAESSVGFSELVMLYLTAYNDENKMQKVKWYIQEANFICGKYALDSARCLDIFLSVSSTYIVNHYKFLIEYLNQSSLISHNGLDITLSQIVCFNLDKCDKDSVATYADMCAIMIKAKLLDGQLLYHNIQPTIDALQKMISDEEDMLERESMKGIDNPLAMAAALTTDEDDDFGDRRNRKPGKPANNEDNTDTVTKDTGIVEDMERSSSIPRKIVLLKSLLSHGCVEDAFLIVNRYPKCVLLDNEIPTLVTRIFEYIIRDIYSSTVLQPSKELAAPQKLMTENEQSLSTKPRLITENLSHNVDTTLSLNSKNIFYFQEWCDGIEQISNIDELFEKSHLLFSLIGFEIAKSGSLLCQICRIAIHDIEKYSVDDTSKLDEWVNYFRKFIFPAVPLLGINPTASNQIYCVMKLFPFEKRYIMYNEMITKLSQDILPLRMASNKAERDLRSILKALSIDTISKEARKLSNLVSSNPLATLIPVVKQIENYDKVSDLVVHSTRYYNDFAYDVLQYVLLLRLTQSRSALQEDGINESMWAQRLSIFIAGLSSECPEMDISNIIVFVIKKLHEGNAIATSILKQLLSKVAGIRDLNEVNNNSIIMLNSGEPLRQEARKLIFDFRDSHKERSSKLVSLFQKEHSITEIIILLYNLKLKTNITTDHYKILSTRSDDLNTLLWSFIELIKFCLSDENFASNVSSFESLHDIHHISVSWICHIWRDVYDKKGQINNTDLEGLLTNVNISHTEFHKIERSLFVKFWRFSLYDIYMDESLYYSEIEKMERKLTAQDLSTRKKKSLQQKKESLLSSLEVQKERIKNIHEYLHPLYGKWTENSDKDSLMSFLQYCIIPRAIFSPSDAIFTTHFIFYGFEVEYILKLLSSFMESNILNTLLFSATISEAGNLGIFFETFLLTLEEKRKANILSAIQKRDLYDCHTSMMDQIVDLLQEKNYMSIRNGIEFMKHVSNVFPVIDEQVGLLISALEYNLTSEEREDIKLPTNALIGHLKARLRKEQLPLNKFCELNEEEMKLKEEQDSEKAEIDNYLRALENEKKEANIRRKLETNKKKREAGIDSSNPDNQDINTENDLDDIYREETRDSRPREVNWPLGKVFRSMSETIYHLKMNNIKDVINTIKDEKLSSTITRCMESAMPEDEFRDTVYNTIKDFYKSLIRYENNPDFVDRLTEVREACNLLSQKQPETIADMYAEDSERTTPSASRYNNTGLVAKSSVLRPNVASKPSRDSYTTNRNDTKPTGRDDARFNRSGDRYKKIEKAHSNSKQNVYQNRQHSTGPERQQSYNRNSNTESSSRGVKRELPTGPEGSSTNKKPRNDTGNFKKNARYAPKSQEEQFYQKDSRNSSSNNNERMRYKGSFNKTKSNNSSTNVTKRFGNTPPKPHLPQGPRNQSSAGSRYQK